MAAATSDASAPTLPESAPPPAGTKRRVSLAELFQAAPSTETLPAAPSAAPPPAPAPLPAAWTKVVGPRLAGVVLGLTEKAAEYTQKKGVKYEAGDVDDDTRDLVDESMTLCLAHWFPDAQLSPTKQLIVALGLAFGDQWIGRRQIESAEDAPDAATTSTPPAPTPTAAPANPDPAVGYGDV